MEKLHQIIQEYQGRTSSLFKTANRVCSYTGLLFKVLQSAEKKGTTLSEELFKIQYRNSKELGSFERNKLFPDDDNIYEFGLRKLREVNPQYSFYAPNRYAEVIKTPPTDEEQIKLDAYKDNQNDDDCLIM